MLEVKQLTRRYGQQLAVDGVDFTIQRGEIVGLLGHNGAGKTTIMKMLSGYLEPDQGRIRLGGIDLAEDPKAVQRQLGYLPESLPVYPDMTVADYLDYAATLKGLEGQPKQAAIRKALAATDIGDRLLAPIHTLSRGYKQRVGVAQAILAEPKLLILDEPTNGLDPAQTEHMRRLVRRLSRDATVILSTHIMQEVEALCDRVLIIRNGRLAVDERLERLRLANEVELASDLPQAAQRLASLAGVAEVRALGDNGYRLVLAEGASQQSLCAAAAALVAEAGAALYRLAPVKRDLESLLREVNRTEEVKDAA
ncbi:ATP-binding cassette domain-containing protein [Gallaecimonas sp. GXIMD4217]|uniref:ABC transporter ATP-binding protein n=1 Tax=Gallaecimonas sp. GXIMD4217 TaxID=3131927 RepID=UPI00311B0517